MGRGNKWNCIILPKGEGNDICPPVKVSLAMERDSFTFLSNLVRTSLACLILRHPTENL